MCIFDALIDKTIRWIEDFLPAIYASSASGSISLLMSFYDGTSIVKSITGALSCGILTLAVAGSLVFLGLSENSVSFVGAMIGFIGAEKIRDKLLLVFNRRFGGNK
ncbi:MULTISPECIES: phage holin, lambda family [Tenebrionibacter/Tenebrionicola group]|jgi:lambda family phage holin|uniref:Phage holin, lambda family n=2 Tax=Tenebrionibacter/Tenebrionicola group TaxID=2969848 RepID=A0A8K0V3U7_9ENTR|nr:MULTISPECIES: phage holin, lambda family [Tenebrionibacter/Tenebrionicola group]MBK4716587.1 phage holin, lambda family [Tenebrionibacter intestinalis]MBV5097309.1 phage holin, lambda family [Tenebrionicola larvae]